MLFDRLTTGIRPFVILTLICAALYGPGLVSLSPMDRDESRFMQATRQMLESGDYIRIRFQDELRAKKPAGVYWLQAAAVRALSHPVSTQTWPYRLPSALAAWAAVLMTFSFGRGLLGTRPAFFGAVLLASAAILISEAHQAKTDAVLLACVVAAQGALGRLYVSSRAMELRRGPVEQGQAPPPDLAETLTFWLAQGVGVLIKGPIVPMVSILTILALVIADRSGRWLIRLRPTFGFILAAAVAAPWFVAVSHATDGAFVGAAIKSDLLPKLLGAQESHGGFPGWYLLLALALMWPGSLVIGPALLTLWGDRHRLAFRFLLAWAVPCWLVFELIPTKLPHYVLPAFPAVMLLAGAKLCEGIGPFKISGRTAFAVLWGLVGFGLAAAVLMLPMRLGAGFDPSVLPIAMGIVMATILAQALVVMGRFDQAVPAVVLLALVTWPPTLIRVAPQLEQLWVSRAVAQAVEQLAVQGPVASAGYGEPSLVFLLGTQTKLTSGSGAADFLAQHHTGAAVVDKPEQDAFLTQAHRLGLDPKPLAQVQGLNYSRGKTVDLTIYGESAP